MSFTGHLALSDALFYVILAIDLCVKIYTEGAGGIGKLCH